MKMISSTSTTSTSGVTFISGWARPFLPLAPAAWTSIAMFGLPRLSAGGGGAVGGPAVHPQRHAGEPDFLGHPVDRPHLSVRHAHVRPQDQLAARFPPAGGAQRLLQLGGRHLVLVEIQLPAIRHRQDERFGLLVLF